MEELGIEYHGIGRHNWAKSKNIKSPNGKSQSRTVF
jgi:hypothetical protein